MPVCLPPPLPLCPCALPSPHSDTHAAQVHIEPRLIAEWADRQSAGLEQRPPCLPPERKLIQTPALRMSPMWSPSPLSMSTPGRSTLTPLPTSASAPLFRPSDLPSGSPSPGMSRCSSPRSLPSPVPFRLDADRPLQSHPPGPGRAREAARSRGVPKRSKNIQEAAILALKALDTAETASTVHEKSLVQPPLVVDNVGQLDKMERLTRTEIMYMEVEVRERHIEVCGTATCGCMTYTRRTRRMTVIRRWSGRWAFSTRI